MYLSCVYWDVKPYTLTHPRSLHVKSHGITAYTCEGVCWCWSFIDDPSEWHRSLYVTLIV